jgi:hypothetical protein
MHVCFHRDLFSDNQIYLLHYSPDMYICCLNTEYFLQSVLFRPEIYGYEHENWKSAILQYRCYGRDCKDIYLQRDEVPEIYILH